MLDTREEPTFSKEEKEEVREFFAGEVGQKILETLDIRGASKNNLLHVMNLAGDSMDANRIGFRCSLHAAEARVYLEVLELLKNAGDDYAD